MNRIGRYEIQSELGRGGFGIVYRAHDPSMRRDVAVKVLTAVSEADAIARFRGEVGVTASLRHKNIITVHDYGEHEHQPFLVMELLEGKSLQETIRLKAPMPLFERVSILKQMADGFQYAHEHGLVHRDIKPSNVMVLEDGSVRILDFGIAKFMEQGRTRHTATGFLVGTMEYMAPEQLIKGMDADVLTDIFSYGATAYELLSGVQPFRADSISQTFYRLTAVEPEPIHRFVGEDAEGLAAVVHAAISKDRGKRYQSMQDIRFDLAPIEATLRRRRGAAFAAEGRSRIAQSDAEGAQAWLRKALEVDPASEDALELRRELQKEVQQKRDRHQALLDEAAGLVRNAEKLSESKDYRGAVEALESALRILPPGSDGRIGEELERRLASARALRDAAERQEEEAALREAERQRAEAERVRAEREAQARLAAERTEAERLEAQRKEAARVEAETREAGRQEAERRERAAAERVRAEREAERVRLEREAMARLESERLEAERREAARRATELTAAASTPVLPPAAAAESKPGKRLPIPVIAAGAALLAAGGGYLLLHPAPQAARTAVTEDVRPTTPGGVAAAPGDSGVKSAPSVETGPAAEKGSDRREEQPRAGFEKPLPPRIKEKFDTAELPSAARGPSPPAGRKDPVNSTASTGPAAAANVSAVDRKEPPPVVAPPKIGEFGAQPASIERGQAAVLRWNVGGNVTAVSIDHGVGIVRSADSRRVSPADTQTYTLVATGPGGTVSATQMIQVTVPPAVDSIAADRKAIQQTLSGYAQAMHAKDEQAIRALWPAVPAAQMEKFKADFQGAQSITMDLRPAAIDPQGDTARVQCNAVISKSYGDGQVYKTESAMRITLRKQGGAWKIESVR